MTTKLKFLYSTCISTIKTCIKYCFLAQWTHLADRKLNKIYAYIEKNKQQRKKYYTFYFPFQNIKHRQTIQDCSKNEQQTDYEE